MAIIMKNITSGDQPIKNILLIEAANNFGGSVRGLINIVNCLDYKKHRAVVIFLYPGNHVNQFKAETNNKADLFIFKSPIFFGLLNNKLFNFLFIIIERIYHFLASLIIMRFKRIQLVHSNNGVYYPIVFASKINRIPVIAYLRSQPNKLTRMTKFASKNINLFIAVSNAVKQTYMSEQIPNDKIKIVYDGIDVPIYLDNIQRAQLRNEFDFKDNDIVIGTVARLDDIKKGITYLIESAVDIIKTEPNAKFFIIGGDPKGLTLKSFLDKTNKLGLDQKIHFTGFRTDVLKLMQLMDIFVSPSLSNQKGLGEGLPIVILEAMVLGVPIITTEVAGIPEVIEHNTNGVLIPSANKRAISEAVIELINNQQLRLKIRDNALQTVKLNFNLTRFAEQINSIYDDFNNAKMVNRQE